MFVKKIQYKYSVLGIATFLVAIINNVSSQQATLYDDRNYGGQSLNIDEVGGCRNYLEFNDKTSSIKTSVCMRAWENYNCGGRRVEINPPGIDSLVSVNFNDMLTSVSDCTVGVPGDIVQINMDTSKAPDLEGFGRNVKKTMQDWFPFVQNLMMTPAYSPIKSIDVSFDPEYDGAAYASGGKIVGSANFFRQHQDDYGAFIHEMTHVIHENRNCPGWIVEGYAEWTRRWFYEPWTAKTKPTSKNKYTDGYTTAAWLLTYVNSAITGKPMLFLLNKACQEGTYYDGIWKDLTGKTVDQLWEDMLNDPNYPWK